MFDPNREKERVYELLSSSKVDEIHFTREELLQKSLDIAKDEYDELVKAYANLYKSINHLVISQQPIHLSLMKEVEQRLRNIKEFIEKTYTREELDQMPDHVYSTIVHTQKDRAEYLKKIANTYLNH